jgi:hypothetical protein
MIQCARWNRAGFRPVGEQLLSYSIAIDERRRSDAHAESECRSVALRKWPPLPHGGKTNFDDQHQRSPGTFPPWRLHQGMRVCARLRANAMSVRMRGRDLFAVPQPRFPMRQVYIRVSRRFRKGASDALGTRQLSRLLWCLTNVSSVAVQATRVNYRSHGTAVQAAGAGRQIVDPRGTNCLPCNRGGNRALIASSSRGGCVSRWQKCCPVFH